jgi:vacuolar protein 8
MEQRIKELVRALGEGDDAAKEAAAGALYNRAFGNVINKAAIAEAGGIPPLVELLRDGSADAKRRAAWALCTLAYISANKDLIAAAGGIPPLVELLRDGSVDKIIAVRALQNLAYSNAANKILIAEAGGIPPLVELLRDESADAEQSAASALRHLAHNNDANTVAIAATAGLETLVQLARRGRVTVDKLPILSNAALPAKRKAALVVAALLRDCVPDEKRSQVRDLIRGVIGPYL